MTVMSLIMVEMQQTDSVYRMQFIVNGATVFVQRAMTDAIKEWSTEQGTMH